MTARLAPASALTIAVAESVVLRPPGTISDFGARGGAPFKLTLRGLTISSGTAVVFHSWSSNPGENSRRDLERGIAARATIPNELVADRDVIINAAWPVATPQRDFTPWGPSLLTTSSR